MKEIFNKLRCALWIVAILGAVNARAAMIIGDWTPKFKGVDFTVATNTPGGGMPNHHVVYALRVDLTDPDIHFKTSPKTTINYLNEARETVGMTQSGFLTKYQLQAAINANFFDSPGYYPPAGTLFNIYGLAMNE